MKKLFLIIFCVFSMGVFIKHCFYHEKISEVFLACGSDVWQYGQVPEWNTENVRWKPINGESGFTMADEFGQGDESNLHYGEWFVSFENGSVYGDSLCSSYSGDSRTWAGKDWKAYEKNKQDADNFKYKDNMENCWCRVTVLNQIGCQTTQWIYFDSFNQIGSKNCESYCARSCAYGMVKYQEFRDFVLDLM